MGLSLEREIMRHNLIQVIILAFEINCLLISGRAYKNGCIQSLSMLNFCFKAESNPQQEHVSNEFLTSNSCVTSCC